MAAIIQYRLTGGASNSNPDLSLGGTSSSTQIVTDTPKSIFDDVSDSELTTGDVEYRAVDIFNAGDDTATSVAIYISADTLSTSTEIDIGAVASPLGSTTSVADESTAPTGVTFSHYNSASRLSLPDIPVNNYARVWIRRTVTAGGTNIKTDTCELKVVAA